MPEPAAIRRIPPHPLARIHFPITTFCSLWEAEVHLTTEGLEYSCYQHLEKALAFEPVACDSIPRTLRLEDLDVSRDVYEHARCAGNA